MFNGNSCLPPKRQPCRISAARVTARETVTVSNETAQARQIRLLELEFEYLQKANDKYDNSRFTIKNWAVTVTAGILALSVNAKNFGVALVGFVIVPLFAYLEVLYMYIGDNVVKRCNEIEHLLQYAMRTDGVLLEEGYKFGISQAFIGKFEAKRVLLTIRHRPHIYVLYMGLLAATAIVALVLKFLA